MKVYPEIEKLKQFFNDFSIDIERLSDENTKDTLWMRLTINTKSWKIYVDDEYKDFDESRPLIALFLTLNALEAYKESQDFLVWAKENYLDP